MRLSDQRTDNDRGGCGYRTSAEILGNPRATGAHSWIIFGGAVYDAGSVVWGLYGPIYTQPLTPNNTTFRGVSFGLSSPLGIGGSISVKVDNHGNTFVSGGPTFGISPLVTGSYLIGETRQNGVNVTSEQSVRDVLTGPSAGVTFHPTIGGVNYSWNTFAPGRIPVGFLTVPLPSGTGTTRHAQFGIPEIGYSPQYTVRVPR